MGSPVERRSADRGGAAGFEVLVTADKNMRYQQNLTKRKIALVILPTPQWPILRRHVERIAAAVSSSTPGTYTEVEIPNS